MVLKFILSGQSLSVHPSQERLTIVANSKNYLLAQFDCRTEEWKNGPIWALFTYNDKTYKKLLGAEDGVEWNECYIPHEVLQSPKFEMSVYTGNRITTNIISRKVEKSGYTETAENENITPSTIEQVDKLMKKYALICNSILQDCEKIKEEMKRGE